MILQSSVKRTPIIFVKTSGLLTVMAIMWLLIEDLLRISKPHILTAMYEVRLTIQNDPTFTDIRQAKALLPVASTFTVFYALFLLIEIWS